MRDRHTKTFMYEGKEYIAYAHLLDNGTISCMAQRNANIRVEKIIFKEILYIPLYHDDSDFDMALNRYINDCLSGYAKE